MSRVDPTTIISRWNTMVQHMQQSSNDFYQEVERLIASHNLKDVKLERVNIAEGGLFSSKREYLQVRRQDFVFHVCAAPYGNGFFVSWWFGTVEKGFVAWLKNLPYVGMLFTAVVTPLTYYRIDTANMFNAITSGAVEDTLDSVMAKQQIKALTYEQKKPMMRELFAHGK
jgi:hypothetical protein